MILLKMCINFSRGGWVEGGQDGVRGGSLHKNLIHIFSPAHNSYPHTMFPVARLKWSAFLGARFTTL